MVGCVFSFSKLIFFHSHAEKKFKKGSSRVLYNVHPSYSSVAVCVLGKHGTGYNELEGLEEGRENVRAAVSGLFV